MQTTLRLLALLLALLPAAVAADSLSALPEPGRVVLAPLNLGIRAEPQLEVGLEPVWTELVGVLEQRNPPPAALQREAAAALWAEVVRAGEGDGAEPGVYAAYARFARRVAEQVPFDALVMPALVPRRAEIHGHQAFWDGVGRLVDTPQIASLDAQSGLRAAGSRGSLGAASLHVAVLAPDGSIRFEGAGGVALLQGLALDRDGFGSTLAVVDRHEPFADRELLRRGVLAAFDRPLPASRER